MILLRTGLIGAALLASFSYGMAQTTGPDRAETDAGPPGFSQKYDRGAESKPEQGAPPLRSEGRSESSPAMRGGGMTGSPMTEGSDSR